MRSKFIGPQYWTPFCEAVFGKDYASDPNVDWINQSRGALDIQGSKIIFANAIEDPWRYAGMQKIQDPTTQSGMEAVLINCQNCAHCVDLKTPSPVDAPTLTNARNKIKAKLTLWLTPSKEEIEAALSKKTTPQTFLE